MRTPGNWKYRITVSDVLLVSDDGLAKPPTIGVAFSGMFPVMYHWRVAAERFQFGNNWLNYLAVVNESHVSEATARLSELVGDLSGKTFLDVGCGSGIHSLAALRLGASRVHSFDCDPQSVACSREMKRRFAPESNWTVEQGSALDEAYLRSLGKFDIVYAWGVLHHTGDMWRALDLVTIPAERTIALAIYNDQGLASRFWRALKLRYNRSGDVGRRALQAYCFLWLSGKGFLIHPRWSMQHWRNYRKERGMSAWHDIVDWAGGYPFEVARPADVIAFYESRHWRIERFAAPHPRSCNEFVFARG